MTAGKIQKYADATLFDLTRVIDAADRLYGCIAEFPDDPSIWGEYIDALDAALESCPGTSANYHALRRKNIPPENWQDDPDTNEI